GVADFTDRAAAVVSPLARVLFEIDGVDGVFLGSDFVTITKSADKDWQVLKPMALGAIMDHFTAGAPVMEAGAESAADEEFADEGVDGEIISQIKELIETRVRPAVAQDGGDIVYRGF